MSRRWFGAALLAIALGCGDSASSLTELALTIDSPDMHPPTDIDAFTIDVMNVVKSERARARLRSAQDVPASISLVLEGDRLGPIRVTASAWLGDKLVIERTVSVTFKKGQTKYVLIKLDRACAGVFCTAGKTCDEGECRSIADTGTTPPIAGRGGMSGGMSGSGSGGMLASGGAGGSGGNAGTGDSGDGGGGESGTGGMSGTSGSGGQTAGSGGMPNLMPSCVVRRPNSTDPPFELNATVQLRASCTNPKGGMVDIVWSDENDKKLASTQNPNVMANAIGVGSHAIKVCVSEAGGTSALCSAPVMIAINMPAAPTTTIDSVTQNGTDNDLTYVATAPVDFRGTSMGYMVVPSWHDSLVGDFATSLLAAMDTPEIGRHRVTLFGTDGFARMVDAPPSATFVVLPDQAASLVQPFTMVNTSLVADGGGAVDALVVDSMAQALASSALPNLYRFDASNTAATASLAFDTNPTLGARVRALLLRESTEHSLYIGTDDGLVVCTNYMPIMPIAAASCTTYKGGAMPAATAIPDDHINAVVRFAALDSVEYLALGTKKGLFLSPLATIGVGATVLPNDDIAGAVAIGGKLWIASRSSGLYEYDPTTPATLPVPHNSGEMPSQQLSAIVIDQKGVIWVGSDSGLGRFDPNPAATTPWQKWGTGDPPAPNLTNNNVRCLASTHVTIGSTAHDVIWIGTDDGVSRFDYDLFSFMTLMESDGFPNKKVLSMAVMPNGNKLFGTETGVAVYVGK